MSAGTVETPAPPARRPTKAEAARVVARRHYEVEPGMVTIFRLEEPDETDQDPLKLLEVNRDTIAAGIMPLGFPASAARGVPFSTVIVEITPEELDQVRSGTLALPAGWQMAEEIRPAAPGE